MRFQSSVVVFKTPDRFPKRTHSVSSNTPCGISAHNCPTPPGLRNDISGASRGTSSSSAAKGSETDVESLGSDRLVPANVDLTGLQIMINTFYIVHKNGVPSIWQVGPQRLLGLLRRKSDVKLACDQPADTRRQALTQLRQIFPGHRLGRSRKEKN
jgi:hypothetical protein